MFKVIKFPKESCFKGQFRYVFRNDFVSVKTYTEVNNIFFGVKGNFSMIKKMALLNLEKKASTTNEKSSPANKNLKYAITGFISWYVVSTALYIPLGIVAGKAGEGALVLLPLLLILWVATPKCLILLFAVGIKVASSRWLGLGILGAYLTNLIGSFLFSPFLGEYLIKIGVFISPYGGASSPNGWLGLTGLPFFINF
jgi:hypothetical protein